jgi:hypothetical protein
LGRLQENGTGRCFEMEPEYVIGRSPISSLVIKNHMVSSQHAVLRWTGSEWILRDLGSRNGTLVDGVRVLRTPQSIKRGAVLCFGTSEESWTLVDASPPLPLLFPLDGGPPVAIIGDLIALPSSEDPSVTLFRDADGGWRLERGDEATIPLDTGDTVRVGNFQWRFRDPGSLVRTTEFVQSDTSEPVLSFTVSSDEEHVELRADVADVQIDLGASPRYYLLLTLARQRAADRVAGLSETSCGWVYQDDLMRSLGVGQQQLNIDVFRIRRQVSDKGLPGAATIIERRPRTRQLRLGWRHFDIRRI